MAQPDIDLSPKVSDSIAKTTCYMCACRCGINVHLREGENGEPKVRYIEGNRDHPVNRGVLCAKGSAGIMQHYSPARLQGPLLRVGERGSGEFKEISWDEALEKAVSWLAPIRASDPKKLAFFTGRDQSQALTSMWAQQFGTPNYAAHGGFCSVNMAAAGIYTIGGAFWEFGQPDWERSKMCMVFGVAEDHDSNPIKLGLSEMKSHGGKIVGVNPVRTGYNAIADEWVGITPGTDGLFILSMIHVLLSGGKVDVDYLIRYTNAAWLVIDDPGAADHGLFARNEGGETLVAGRDDNVLHASGERGFVPKLKGKVVLADGRSATPVFELLAKAYLDERYAPENVAAETGVPAETIRRLAAELAHFAFDEEIVIEQPWTDMTGERHETMIGRPVSFHAMRGISAHSNGFQTCRALHVLQILLGSIDCPGGFRFKPPYPKPLDAHPKPHGGSTADTPLAGPNLGYPRGPEDLLLAADGSGERIDKAYTWDAPMAAHGMMHMVISNAYAGDPYKVDTLFFYMANMAWNSSMNTGSVISMLEAKDESGDYVIPHIIYSDAYSSEMVAYADLILPDTTYLERHDCISLLDRPICEPDKVADAIRWPVLPPNLEEGRNVRGFQSALIDLGSRLGLPAFTNEDGSAKYSDYGDYIVNHERKPGIGPLAGFRGAEGDKSGRGEVNPDQLDRYIENGGFWTKELPPEAQFYKHANRAYQDFAVEMGFFDAPAPVTFQLYLEPVQKFRLAAEGHGDVQPPDHLADRIKATFDPLPTWYLPLEDESLEAAGDAETYPYHAVTQRPMAMYHSWGSQNAWLRQIHGLNPMYIPAAICDEHDLADGDWAHIISAHGKIKVPVKRMQAVNSKTLWTWNAIGKRRRAWNLSMDAPESEKGFLLNHLINELLPPKGDGHRWANSDPMTGQAAWYDLKVRVEKAEAGNAVSQPQFPILVEPPDLDPAPDVLTYGKEWTK